MPLSLYLSCLSILKITHEFKEIKFLIEKKTGNTY